MAILADTDIREYKNSAIDISANNLINTIYIHIYIGLDYLTHLFALFLLLLPCGLVSRQYMIARKKFYSQANFDYCFCFPACLSFRVVIIVFNFPNTAVLWNQLVLFCLIVFVLIFVSLI